MLNNTSKPFRTSTQMLSILFILLCRIRRMAEQQRTFRAPVTPRQSKRLVRSPEESPSKRKRTTVDVEAQVHAQDIPPSPRPEGVPNDEAIAMPPPPRRPPVRRRLSGARRRVNINVESPSRWQRTRLDRPAVDLTSLVARPAQQIAHRDDPRDLIALILAGVHHDDSDIISVARAAQENISTESVRTNLTAVDNTLGRTIEPIAEQDIHIQEVLAPLPEPNVAQRDYTPDLPSPRFSNILRENEEDMNVSNIAILRLHASTPKSNEILFETALQRQNNLLARIRALFLQNGNAAIQLEQLCGVLNKYNVSKTFCDLLCLHSKQYIKMEYVAGTIELGNIYPGQKLHS